MKALSFLVTFIGAAMKALSFLVTFISLFAAGYAAAADLQLKAAPYAPPPPAITWAGFYVGADAGYMFDAPLKFDTTLTTVTSVNQHSPFFGGFVGHNWQVGPLVLGLELDVQSATGSKSVAVGTTEVPVTLRSKVDFFGSARARVGLSTLNDSLLWYITGGEGFVHNTADIITAGTTVATAPTTHIMPVVGAGLEWRMFGSQSWLLRVEYQRYIASKSTYAFGGAASGNVPAQLDLDTVRLGLAYKF